MRSAISDPILWALIVVAALVRLVGLGAEGLWLDEAFTALVAAGPPAHLPELLRYDSGPPLHYLLTGVVVRLLGASELAVRLPSALAGILTVPLAWAAARRFGAPRSAWVVALMVAVMPLLVVHARDARYYAFLVPAGLLVLIALDRALERGRPADVAVLAGLLTLTAYLHNYGLLLLPAGVAAALVRRRHLARVLLAHGIAALAYLPWAPVLLAQIRFGGTGWTSDHFTAAAPWQTIVAWMPLGTVPPYLPMLREPGAGEVGIALALLVLFAIAGILWRNRALATDRMLAVMLVVPPALVYLVSLVGPSIYLVARADLLFLPAALVLLARALETRRSRVIPIGFALVWVLASGIALRGALGTDLRSGDRALAEHLEARIQPGDVVVPVGLAYASLAWYLPDATLVPLPVSMVEHPGNLDQPSLRADPGGAMRAFDRALADAVATSPATATVWAVRSPGPLGGMLAAHLDGRLVRATDPVTFRMGILGTPLEVVGYVQRGRGGDR